MEIRVLTLKILHFAQDDIMSCCEQSPFTTYYYLVNTNPAQGLLKNLGGVAFHTLIDNSSLWPSGFGVDCIILLLGIGVVMIIPVIIAIFFIIILVVIVSRGPATVYVTVFLGFCPLYYKHAAYPGAFFFSQQTRIPTDGNFN